MITAGAKVTAESAEAKASPDMLPLRSKVLLLISCLCLTLIVGTIIWGRNKGFCITDEAFYIMNIVDPQLYHCSTSKFGFILNKLPKLSASAIVSARLWQLIIELAGASMLAFGFLNFAGERCRFTTSQRVIVLVTACASQLLIFSIFPLSASYNSLIGATAFASTGSLLWSLYQSKSNKLVGLSFCGIFLCLAILTKVTSGLLLAPLLLAMLIWKEKWGSQFFRSATVLFVSALFAAWLYFLTVEPFDLGVAGFLESSQILKGTGIYSFEMVFNKYVLSLVRLGLHTLVATAAIIAISLAAQKTIRRLAPQYSIRHGGAFILLASAIIVFHFSNYLNTSSNSVNAFYAIPVVLAVLTAWHSKSSKWELRELVSNAPLLLVPLLPVICSVGTNNDVVRHTKIFTAPLVLVSLYLAHRLTRLRRDDAPMFCASVLYLLVIALQFTSGFLNTPYGIPLPLAAQKEKCNAANLKGIKQCHGAASFFNAYSSLLLENGFRPNDIIVAPYGLPGLVYAVGGRSPKLASVVGGRCGNVMLETCLKEVNREAPSQFFVVTNYEYSDLVRNGFAKAGYDFPKEFERLGSIVCPYDAPEVNITTGKADLGDLHNKIAVFKYAKETR